MNPYVYIMNEIPSLPSTFLNMIISMMKLMMAVLKKSAIDNLIARLILNLVSVESYSASQM
jgi:hypothetical protein